MEKGDEFVPKDACKQANKRRRKVEDEAHGEHACRCFCQNSGFDCEETD